MPRFLLYWCLCTFAALACLTPAKAGETTVYSYDALGRLVSATSSGTVNDGLATTIAYDPAGNRQSYTVAGSGAAMLVILDGSFEQPPQNGGFAYGPTVGGVTFSGGAGVQGNGSAWGFANAPDGSQTGFLQTGSVGGSIAFAVSGLTPGASYQARFSIAQRTNWGGVATITVSFNGTPIGTFTPASGAFAQVTTASFTASAATGTLTFSVPAGTGDTSAAIDAVSVAAAAAATVADGSFETPSLGGSGYVTRPTVTGLTFTGWSGITSNSSDWGYAAAPDGSQAAFMDMAPDGIIVTVTMTVGGLTPGTAYRVAFQAARRPFYTPATVRVAINGTALGDYTPVATTNAYTAFATPNFTAGAASATLTFTGVTQGDIAIDKVGVGP